ncbi:ABC-2 type transporter [Colletotrichum salicis]|uniref:ABC-2 type transporter n=1 Tax=Colletotrichum salicis TaxID=1209931 RepID=A0A135V7A7_9PEZI|nr:ABC-2 type transporter [Colletotrichum salicis]
MTSPNERKARLGYDNLAPRTPDEFVARWKASEQHANLMADIAAYDSNHSSKDRFEAFQDSIRAERIKLCLWRGWKRLVADPEFTLSSLIFNIIVLTLYTQRRVIEKHNQYALYYQSAEAISSYITELPYKITNVFTFNSILYFMANLNREAGPFFFFCLVSFLVLLAMSGIYRTMASLVRTSHRAMVPVTLVTIGVMMYAGFTVPTAYMQGWSRWVGYVNPLSYAFEAPMANELHGRQFLCAGLVPSGPGYDGLAISGRTCAVVGAVPGSNMIDGDRYIEQSFGYFNDNKCRNVGILCAYVVVFFVTYIITAEYAKPPKSEGEVLVFRRGKVPSVMDQNALADEESQYRNTTLTEKVTAVPTEEKSEKRPRPSECDKPIFHWEDICYDVKIKDQDRRILDFVDGWVQPGVITALMGASGAGKTTLLDALAARITMGVISGDTMVNGQATDRSFPNRVGYVQQQDVHLDAMTVREALEFSALLRQSAETPREAKLAYIDAVIELLDMSGFVDAVIGVPGQGLSVEQRKRLTIGFELAARPQLLVFLDEPTSGQDSQTSWAICDLIEKLVKSGQAILCTIHQPSTMLFARFDRLLLLQCGGKTVYFGDIISKNAQTMIDYLERNGALPCPPDASPAEWMLKAITLSEDGPNWYEIWRSSPEYREVKNELGLLRQQGQDKPITKAADDDVANQEFASSFWTQFVQVFVRTAKHFWRYPVYIWSKLTLTILLALHIRFTFKSDNSLQGLQNQLYAFFMCLTTVNEFSKQIMPMFIPQRALYEVRERPSRVYRWTTYFLSNIAIEMIWNTIAAVVFFFCWYYPAKFYRNTTPEGVTVRGFTVFLFIWMFFLWVSTFSQLAIAAIETADLPSIPGSLFAILCMLFCGVGVIRADLPAIWSDFMYWVSPMTYLGYHSQPHSTVLDILRQSAQAT